MESVQWMAQRINSLLEYMQYGYALIAYRKQDGSFYMGRGTLVSYESDFKKKHDMTSIKAHVAMEAYLLHDANAGSNLKLMIMIQEEGMKGYGIYWTVLEFLRLQNEYKASLKVIPILAQKARVTTATLKRIIYDYALFEVNETSFSSPGLSRRMEPWDAQQEAKKEAGRRGGLVNQQRIRDAKTSSALANKLNKENKENPSLSPQGETGRRKEEILLTPPEYTLNRQTHNYQGLMEELARQKVTDIHDLNAILRLTDFGKLGGKIWKILYELNSSPQLKARIVMPGKYILKLLRG